MDPSIFVIIGVILFLIAVTGGAVYVAQHSEAAQKTEKKAEEPCETRSCVLCNHTGTTWSKLAPYECCERIAIVCSICEREAGDKLEMRVADWHQRLWCPESIAAEPIFGEMAEQEEKALQSMRNNPDAVHQANLTAALLHRTEKEVSAELSTKLKWANSMVQNIATEEERKALWIALSARYANKDFAQAVEGVIRNTV